MNRTKKRQIGWKRYFASRCKTMAQVVNFTKPRASHNSEKSAELRDAACAIRVRGYTWATRLKRKFPSGETLWQYPISYRLEKFSSADRGMWLIPICRPCSPPLYLKATQVSVLSPKSEERVHKENDAFDNTERTFGQAGIAERWLIRIFMEVVDIERARSNEQGASNEREEEILKSKRSDLVKMSIYVL